MKQLKINQIVTYSNNGTYTGKVVAIGSNDYYTIIDHNNNAAVELWNAGYAIGSYIHISQIIK